MPRVRVGGRAWFRRTRTLAESGEGERESRVRRSGIAGAMRQREAVVSSRQPCRCECAMVPLRSSRGRPLLRGSSALPPASAPT